MHVFSKDKWGYINRTGKKVIDDKYESAKPFKNGKAEVRKDGKSFYIDKNGKKV